MNFACKPASNLGNLTKICASTPVEVAHTDAQGSCGVALSCGLRRSSQIFLDRKYILAFLVFTAITAALFVLTCFVMSKSFKRIVSTKAEGSKAEFKDSQIQTRSIGAALRRKEFKHFTSSVTYMVNCGLGILFLIAGAALLLIKASDIRFLLSSLTAGAPLFASLMPVFGAFGVCLLSSMCDIAAPGISLEGKNIWLLQTMPVDPYEIFKAKIFLHVSITGIPALICTIAMIIVLTPDVFTAICMILCVIAFV